MKNLSNISVQYIKGVGPARKKLFANLGVETVEDLFYLFPRRYEDRRQMTPIAQLEIGKFHTISGKILSKDSRKSWYTKKHVYEIIVDDGSGRVTCVWFSQPYLEHYLKPGSTAVLYGKVDRYKNRIQMVSPEYEVIEEEDEDSLSIGRIVPIYPLTRGMTQRYIRKVMRSALDKYLDNFEDVLPVAVRNKHRLVNIKRSLSNIHFPESFESQEHAYRRVSFEEFFLFQVSVILRRLSIVKKPGVSHQITKDLIAEFCASFPFELTGAQKKVIAEIAGDLQGGSPMLRLLQGDVGSGKTLVALFGCIASFQNDRQSAIMAPTEILARQHFENMNEILKGFQHQRIKGSESASIPRLALLTSSMKKKEHEKTLQDIKEGKIDLVVGTHALLSEAVEFRDLSFVVIDEQHKFGVRQRALLSKKGINPDVLIMTATPIPRTLCMTLYGDLDVSTIDEMPKGRGCIVTKLYHDQDAEDVYAIIREKVTSGQQAYIVYPTIEESAKLDLKAAKSMYKRFRDKEFKDHRLGLVHGQMKRAEADAIMDRFKSKKIDILVATTVLEVGVDVPSANVMVIEHAERFGLSQLHQLRGRIGRGTDDAVCILVADPNTEQGTERLKAILSSSDGFVIAENDLLIRGPGQYFGRHQHGLNELKVANPVTQMDILELARQEAAEFLRDDPQLNEPQDQKVKQTIQKRYPTYLALAEAG